MAALGAGAANVRRTAVAYAKDPPSHPGALDPMKSNQAEVTRELK